MTNEKIDARVLLKWAQARMHRQSVFQYPNPEVVLEATAEDFYDFVIEHTGMSGPDELNEILDDLGI